MNHDSTVGRVFGHRRRRLPLFASLAFAAEGPAAAESGAAGLTHTRRGAGKPGTAGQRQLDKLIVMLCRPGMPLNAPAQEMPQELPL